MSQLQKHYLRCLHFFVKRPSPRLGIHYFLGFMTTCTVTETNGYEFALFNELKARFKEDDISVPVRVGSHYYYQRRYLSKDYVQYCRRFIPNNEAPPSVYDIMPTGPDDPPEEVIIDEEVIKYTNSLRNYRITAFKVIRYGKRSYSESFFLK